MVKIKRFNSGLLRSNPNKRMEKFIVENHISRESIINISTDNVNINGMALPSITLTYDDGK